MPRRGDDRQGNLFGDASPAGVAPAEASDAQHRLARGLPAGIRCGSSSWAFPGWKGLVYGDAYDQTRLAREGLAAYAQHPLLRSVGLDRTFYAAIPREEFEALAAAVGDGFRFLVKAPNLYTRASTPPERGSSTRRWTDNPLYLDAEHATRSFVEPFAEGLGDAAGPLVFQFSPIPRWKLGDPARFADRLGAFLRALPRGPLYAVEIRNPELLGPAYVEALDSGGAAHCFNVHPTMPSVAQQREALGSASQPATVVRWMLGHGQPYEDAKSRYAPFDRIRDPDPDSREEIAELCVGAARARRPAWVIVNNKAEGSAPESVFKLTELMVHLLKS